MVINFFPPAAGGGVYRPLSFVKYLSGSGWDVTVVTPKPGEFWINDAELEEKVPSGVRVIRTPSISGQRMLGRFRKEKNEVSSRSSSGFGALRKISEFFLVPDTYVGWIPFASREVIRLCGSERFDVIYSTSPPDSSHLVAKKAAKRYSIPWVADFRDPWISLYLRRPPTAMHAAMHRNMEKGVSRADRVIVTTSWQKEKLESLFPWCRVEKIPNGYEEDDFLVPAETAGDNGKFTILHSGMLTLGRSSRPFLEGLRLFLDRNRGAEELVDVTFLGPMESANEVWVGRLGLEKTVIFQGNLPHSECVEIEKRSSLLLLIKHDDPRYRGLVPGKLFEYIGARRPILAIAPEGEASSIIKRLNRGEAVSAGDREGIAAVIERLYSLYTSGKLDSSYSLGEEKEFSRRVQAMKFDKLLREMISERIIS